MLTGRARAAAFVVALLSSLWVAASVPLVAQAMPRSLRVTVLDQANNVVPDLGPADFIVREDKATREVLRAAPVDDPMQIALLVDDSPAVGRYLMDVREALTAFVTAMSSDAPAGGKHTIAILTLSSRPTINTNYTSDQAVLVKGANGIFPRQATAPTLLDGIAEASEGLTKRHAARPVIVVIAPETEDASFRPYDQVLEALESSGAALYVFGVGSPNVDQQDRSIVLDRGTRDSGGLYETVLAGTALKARMTRVADQLTHQYLVTYAHPNSLIPPEHVTVTAARAGLTARGTLVKDENGQQGRP
jgi:hypothetical protein